MHYRATVSSENDSTDNETVTFAADDEDDARDILDTRYGDTEYELQELEAVPPEEIEGGTAEVEDLGAEETAGTEETTGVEETTVDTSDTTDTTDTTEE